MSLEDSVVGDGIEEQTAPLDNEQVVDIAQDDAPQPDTETPAASEQEPAEREPKSPLEAVQQGLEKLKAQEASAVKQPEPEPEPEPPQEDAAPEPDRKDRIPAAEWQKLRPETRATITRLRAERNQYREGAQRYESIDGFMRETGVTPEAAGDALLLAAHVNAAMAGDAKSIDIVVKTLEPLVQQIKSLTGQAILPEYQRMLEDGEVTEEAARHLSKLAAEKAATESRLKQREHRDEVVAKQGAEQVKAAILSSIAEWETETRKSDPDFGRKEELLKELLKGMNAERGIPKSADDARTRLDEAYRKVSQLSGPSRQAVRAPISSAGTAPRAGSAPQPKSPLEAAMAGLARTTQHGFMR